VPNAAGLSALLLLALAGGFVFAERRWPTRYRILRAEGQQVYLYAALYAVLLVFLSLLLLRVGSVVIPDRGECWIAKHWSRLLSPYNLDVPALPPFVLAFVLGWLGGPLLNRLSNYENASRNIINEHGGQLEQFLYDAIIDAQLLFVALDNKKVYVGWATLPPKLKTRLDAATEHFGFLPVRSGYLDQATLEPAYTTEYGPVYERIVEGGLGDLDMADFEILLPMDKVVVIRPYSLDVPQELFSLDPKRRRKVEKALGKARLRDLLHTVLTLLIVRRITRGPRRD
jgi:hypothetical protein